MLILARKSHCVAVVAPFGWSVVNSPPKMACPLASTRIVLTLPFGSGSKPVSRVPSEFRRAAQLRVVAAAPFGETVEKPPPTNIWPVGTTARERTVLSVLGSKVVSSEPSVLNLAMWFRTTGEAEPFGCTVVNEPPIMTCPLGW